MSFFTKRSDNTSFETSYSANTSIDFEKDIGFPGQEPFTRGIHANLYRGRLWTMRQYAGFGSAEETNERFRKLLDLGQTGLSMAFDLPTQMGYDPDESISTGEVGKVGVSISTMDDMETVLTDLPLENISTSMTINSTASILLAFYIAVAKRRNVSLSKIRGTTQNDILKEYIARGTYIFPPKPSMRLTTDIIEYCMKEVPQWNPLSISGYHIREAGSDAVQEVAFTLANAIAYASAATEKGLLFDDFAGNLSFFFASHTNVIEEVSKFRAARKLWAEIALTRFKAKSQKSTILRFHAQTGGSTLTAQQINNNIVRTSLQAMSAILGGCQSLHTNSKDEALSLPTEESAMLALRTQQVIAEESGISHTVDPVAGSYAFEFETKRIFDGAKKLLETIDQIGGSILAIEKNFFQHLISDRAYEFQKQIESGERGIVGINRYVTEETNHAPTAVTPGSKKVEQEVRERLYQFKKNRNPTLVQSHLQKLKNAASTKENIMPLIVDCAENKCTLGEISHALREIFGVYHPQ